MGEICTRKLSAGLCMLNFLIKIKILNRILEDAISFAVLLRGNISTTYYLGFLGNVSLALGPINDCTFSPNIGIF